MEKTVRCPNWEPCWCKLTVRVGSMKLSSFLGEDVCNPAWGGDAVTGHDRD